MKPHEERVLKERDELFEKTVKLGEMVNQPRPDFILPCDFGLLEYQYKIQSELLRILNCRIERFSK